jgi:hypothetical protein
VPSVIGKHLQCRWGVRNLHDIKSQSPEQPLCEPAHWLGSLNEENSIRPVHDLTPSEAEGQYGAQGKRWAVRVRTYSWCIWPGTRQRHSRRSSHDRCSGGGHQDDGRTFPFDVLRAMPDLRHRQRLYTDAFEGHGRASPSHACSTASVVGSKTSRTHGGQRTGGKSRDKSSARGRTEIFKRIWP